MKTIMTKRIIILAAATLWFGDFAQAQNEPAGDNAAQPAAPIAPAPSPQGSGSATNTEDQQQVVGALIQAVVEAQQAATDESAADGGTNKLDDAKFPSSIRGQGTRGTAGSSTNAISLTALVAEQSTNHTLTATKTFRLNFRNAPLSLVLDYLSDAVGFTISANSKVDLKGTVTVWSNQPVDRDAAVRILQKALGEHNYAATVEGNVLNIYVVDSSNAEIVAGIPGNEYTNIPATKDLVTQIVYVRNVESGQLITSLQSLMPAGTSMSANQGANAIVITDTKANIRRMVQLVKALDTASVSASTVRVFPLTYADATALAQVVDQIFTGTGAATQGGPFPGFFGRFGGGGNRGQTQSASSTPAGRVAAAKVVAAADDRSNSLIVSASEEQMALVEELVTQVDVNADEVTELRVFHLLYADPQETADQLTSLFPDPTMQQTSSRRQSGSRGFFGGFNRGGSPGATTADPNSRKTQQTRVTAVPDPRTGSVIVSAARDLMGQIAGIIEQLDSDPAKKKKVYVIKVENRDPQEVVQDLQSVIATDSGGNFSTMRSSSQQSGSQLNTRQQNNLRNTGNNNSTFSTGSRIGSGTGR
jgi:type II secretory pathway component GspD/PulD (secretin)